MTDSPQRIRLSRAKGWRMPENTVKVDRTTKWGNPFVVGQPGGAFTAKVADRRHAWQLYRSVAADNSGLVAAARRELRGKNLACWCALPGPYQADECHAAVLIEIANAPEPEHPAAPLIEEARRARSFPESGGNAPPLNDDIPC